MPDANIEPDADIELDVDIEGLLSDAAKNAVERIAAGAKRSDVVNAACIRNGMNEEEIAIQIDRALTARGE